MDDDRSWLDDPSLVPSVASRVEREASSWQAEAKTYLRCYYDRPVTGNGIDYTRPYRELAVFDALKNSFGGNLTREVVDAACSIICRPLSPEVLPKGAEFELEQGCKQASRLIEGVFDNSDFLTIGKRAFKDACVAGIGPVKAYIDPESEEIKFERVNPLEYFWVDDGTDSPRTRMTISPVSKDQLIARYPDKKAKIKALSTWSPSHVVGVDLPGTGSRGRDADTVKVVDVYCTALGKNSPGKHVITAGDMVLESEEWVHEINPLFGFVWSYDHRGHAGVSLARIVNRYDSANRRLLRMIFAALAGAVPKLLIHEDSEVDGISDVEFEKVVWKGQIPPTIVVPQVVSPDLVQQVERNYVRAYAEGGVNQNMATGSAPSRYTSGAAQREFVDIANTRLLDAQQQWQGGWGYGAKVVTTLAQQARKTHVRVKGANYYESVSFPRLPRDKYKVNFGLSSGLSLTPAGRLDELNDLKEAGVIDIPDVIRSLDLPDTRQIADRVNAPRDLIMRQVSMALDQGIFSMPSALQDLNALMKIAGEEYQRAQMQGNYPPAHLECLRRLIKAAEARLKPPPVAPANDVMGAPVAPEPLPPLPGEVPPPLPPGPPPPMPGEVPPAPMPLAQGVA